jgi:hypothetical protein
MPSIHTTSMTDMYVYYSAPDRLQEHGFNRQKGYIILKRSYVKCHIYQLKTPRSLLIKLQIKH